MIYTFKNKGFEKYLYIFLYFLNQTFFFSFSINTSLFSSIKHSKKDVPVQSKLLVLCFHLLSFSIFKKQTTYSKISIMETRISFWSLFCVQHMLLYVGSEIPFNFLWLFFLYIHIHWDNNFQTLNS